MADGDISLDSVSGAIDSATTSATSAVSSAVSSISSGAASGLSSLGSSISGALGGIGSAISGALGSLGAGIKQLSGVKLPLANPLFDYASYDYVLGLGCLTDAQFHKPDTTYMKNPSSIKLVCKDAAMDPKNRVATPYGQFDFFIDNLVLKSFVGYEKFSNNTNVHAIEFDIIEPYSMGLFIISLQTIAQQTGHNNWRDAPFIMTVDFRGNKENGTMSTVPGTSRYIPFTFIDMSMTVNETGAKYHCKGFPAGQWALSDDAAKLKTDISAEGKTVQEVLQSGPNSLQAMLNKREIEQAKMLPVDDQGNPHVPNQYLILFPTDISSSATPAQSSQNNESSGSSTTSANTTNSPNPPPTATASEIYQKLGVAYSPANDGVVQKDSDCNTIGRTSMGYDETRRGDTPSGKDKGVYNKKGNIFSNASLSAGVDVKSGESRFSQDDTIMSAICQVVLQSNFVNEALDTSKISPEGYRGWFRIDHQLYNITSEVQANTGVKAKLIVYRVVPANVHASHTSPPNTPAPGLAPNGPLAKQAVKQYNYIYTGKNVDVMKFEIKMRNGFIVVMGTDALKRSQDTVTKKQTGGTEGKDVLENNQPAGTTPPKGTQAIGITPTMQKWNLTSTSQDKKGGTSNESQAQRAAKLFNDCFNTPYDMYNLDLEIIGDPYWIIQSGHGNYTSKGSQYTNLNADGTANYQNGEIDIVVNFRTPIDINQTSGLYDFGKASKSGPATSFSGLYCVWNIESHFGGGKFTQVLKGFRRPQQENTITQPKVPLSTKGSKTTQSSGNSDAPPTVASGGPSLPTPSLPSLPSVPSLSQYVSQNSIVTAGINAGKSASGIDISQGI